MANPMTSFASQTDIAKSYEMLKFVAVIDTWLSKTANYYSDAAAAP